MGGSTFTIIATAGDAGGGALTAPLTLNRDIGGYPVGYTFAAGTTLETVLRGVLGGRPNGRVFACSLATASVSAAVDTGLTMDYSYRFRAVGWTPEGRGSVLLGAFTSTSERTTMRLLGGGNNIQHMWPGNTQMGFSSTGITPRALLEYTQDARGVTLVQGDLIHTVTVAGTQTGTGEAQICLLNEKIGGSQGFGVFCEAQIWDGDGVLLRDFHPHYLDGEIVIVDETDNTIYRPSAGSLVEVSQ